MYIFSTLFNLALLRFPVQMSQRIGEELPFSCIHGKLYRVEKPNFKSTRPVFRSPRLNHENLNNHDFQIWITIIFFKMVKTTNQLMPEISHGFSIISCHDSRIEGAQPHGNGGVSRSAMFFHLQHSWSLNRQIWVFSCEIHIESYRII